MDLTQPHSWTRDNFIAGALCLDFANTVGGKGKARAPDYLQDYRDFLAWSVETSLLDGEQAAQLATLSERRAGETVAALGVVRAQRDRFYRIFSTIAADAAMDPADLDGLNADLMGCGGKLEVRPSDGSFQWVWRGLEESLEGPLWPILRSAADLLTGPDLALLRECGRCSWLFLDRSRNKRRRWCQMEVCGNRSKAERHYQRRRGGQN